MVFSPTLGLLGVYFRQICALRPEELYRIDDGILRSGAAGEGGREARSLCLYCQHCLHLSVIGSSCRRQQLPVSVCVVVRGVCKVCFVLSVCVVCIFISDGHMFLLSVVYACVFCQFCSCLYVLYAVVCYEKSLCSYSKESVSTYSHQQCLCGSVMPAVSVQQSGVSVFVIWQDSYTVTAAPRV